MEQVKLLSMTAVLTVLIWASADSLVRETVTLEVSFILEPAALGSTMIAEVDASAGSCEVEFVGPRKLIEQVRSQRRREVRLRISDRPTGRTDLVLDKQQLREALARRWMDFEKLTIVSVRPSTLPVWIDHLTTVEVDVTARRWTFAYDGEPKLSHTRAELRLRESVLWSLPQSGRPAPLDISVDAERLLAERPAGQSVTVSVPLDVAIFGPDAEISPGSVEVTATVSLQLATEEIPTVPILLAVSFGNLERPFSAMPRDGVSPVTRTIKVTGPREAIQRLLSRETRVYGIIRIAEDDLVEWDDFRPMRPDYRLPAGVELAEDPEPIEFKLIRQSRTE